MEITACPRLEITSDTWDLLMAADLAEMGSWPYLAGWMDQTASCVDGVRFCRSEKEMWKSRLIKEAGK